MMIIAEHVTAVVNLPNQSRYCRLWPCCSAWITRLIPISWAVIDKSTHCQPELEGVSTDTVASGSLVSCG